MSRPVPPMKWWQWIALPLCLVAAAYVGDLFALSSVPFDREPTLVLRVSYAALVVATCLAILYWVRRLQAGPGRTLRYRVLPVIFGVMAVLKIPSVLTATSTETRWVAGGGVVLSALGVVALLHEERKKRREAG